MITIPTKSKSTVAGQSQPTIRNSYIGTSNWAECLDLTPNGQCWRIIFAASMVASHHVSHMHLLPPTDAATGKHNLWTTGSTARPGQHGLDGPSSREGPMRVQPGTRAPNLVQIQPPSSPPRVLCAARFLRHDSAAHPLVFLLVTPLSINPHPLKKKNSAPWKAVLQYASYTTNAQGGKTLLYGRGGRRREARRRQAGMERSGSVLCHGERGKENSSVWEKGLCLESFPSHNPQHNLQCSGITGELGEKHADITCWKRFKTPHRFSLGSSNTHWQLLSTFKGKEKKAATSANRNTRPRFVFSYGDWCD